MPSPDEATETAPGAASKTEPGEATKVAPDEAPVRFTLTGPSRPFDPAYQAIRPDLADIAEAAHHFAPHYAAPVACIASCATVLRATPADDADPVVQLPEGGAFALLDLTGGWAWGYAVDGHTVGYVPRGNLDLA